MEHLIQITAHNSLRKKVGSGSSTKFWLDNWLDVGVLKEKFPKLFSKSTQQDCHVADMEHLSQDAWHWNFSWRRHLFVWEEQLLHEMLQIINQYNFMEGLDDTTIWRYDASGEFTCKSFSLQIFRSAASSLSVYSRARVAWKGVAPPRVEILVWFVLLELVNTKDRLCRFGCIPASDSLCVLCFNNA